MKPASPRLLALTLVLSLAVAGCAPSTTTPAKSSQNAESTPAKSTQNAENTPSATQNTDSNPTQSTDPSPVQNTELIVFAAASMTETLSEIKDIFETAHPGVKITYNFDSSGTLKTQIQEGAACDVFISAGQKQMNQLDKDASTDVNTEGLDFVQEGTRMNLLENKVTLCVPEGNRAGIQSFDDLAEKLKEQDVLLCMGNSDVPVGQYTQKILAWYDLDEGELANAGCITYGTNVKEVTTQITEASVDAGIIYCTDAFSAGLTPIDSATAEMCGQVIYPAAVLNTSQDQELALEFLTFLRTDDAMKVFESVGFSPAE